MHCNFVVCLEQELCPAPKTPENAVFMSRNVFEGNEDSLANVVVKFQCKDGFEPAEDSSDVLICRDGVTWQGIFVCQGNQYSAHKLNMCSEQCDYFIVSCSGRGSGWADFRIHSELHSNS